jgi:ATP-dependent DNA helicase RecG
VQPPRKFNTIEFQLHKVLIYNDGKLPENWTVEDLFAPHTSKPHNPLIAGAFFRSGQIEAWGRGIEKIITACKAWDKPEPFYRVRTNELMIGFHIDIGIVDSIVDNDDTGKMRAMILELMRRNPKISAAKIAKSIGIAPRNAQAHIRVLKEMGLIKRVGSTRWGYWVVYNE